MVRVAHSVGLAVGDDDGGVVQEPVQGIACGGVFGQGTVPVARTPRVGGAREGAAFVGGGDEPEQELGIPVSSAGANAISSEMTRSFLRR